MHVNGHLTEYLPRKCRRKKKYRYLKARIKLKYPDEILFISPGYRIQKVVISRHCLETKTIYSIPQKGRHTKSCKNIA